jgi:hypothetical protein
MKSTKPVATFKILKRNIRVNKETILTFVLFTYLVVFFSNQRSVKLDIS